MPTRDKCVRMRFSSPAGRVAAGVLAVGALVIGGVAYAETGAPATRIDGSASATDTAFRVTTTTTTPPTPPTVMAPDWETKGPGTLQFPMNPDPQCIVLDNFGDGRSGGRTHLGTDMLASLGQGVYAVEDGVLYRQWVDGEDNTGLSGNGWNLEGESGDTYSFLHLSGFAEGLEVGSEVVRGQLIGYVGDTGNPGPGNYHLHFEVHPGGDSAVNAYPLLDIPIACTTY